MTTRKQVNPIQPELAEPVVPDPDSLAITARQPVGRIVHDDRGNAVWKWGDDTATFDTTSDATSGILKHIDPQDLTVQGNGSGESTWTGVVDAGGGYDPYNQGEPRTKGIPDKGSKRKR